MILYEVCGACKWARIVGLCVSWRVFMRLYKMSGGRMGGCDGVMVLGDRVVVGSVEVKF